MQLYSTHTHRTHRTRTPMCVCARARVRACNYTAHEEQCGLFVRACVRACVRVCTCDSTRRPMLSSGKTYCLSSLCGCDDSFARVLFFCDLCVFVWVGATIYHLCVGVMTLLRVCFFGCMCVCVCGGRPCGDVRVFDGKADCNPQIRTQE